MSLHATRSRRASRRDTTGPGHSARTESSRPGGRTTSAYDPDAQSVDPNRGATRTEDLSYGNAGDQRGVIPTHEGGGDGGHPVLTRSQRRKARRLHEQKLEAALGEVKQLLRKHGLQRDLDLGEEVHAEKINAALNKLSYEVREQELMPALRRCVEALKGLSASMDPEERRTKKLEAMIDGLQQVLDAHPTPEKVAEENKKLSEFITAMIKLQLDSMSAIIKNFAAR